MKEFVLLLISKFVKVLALKDKRQGRSQKFLIGEADLVLDYEIMLH